MFSWNSLAFLMIQWMLAISSLENKMATHSSILAWKIPWTEELLRLQSMGSQRVGHDWVTSHSLSLSSAFYKSSLNIWSSLFIYYWSLAWRILSITLLVCEMSAIVKYIPHQSHRMPCFCLAHLGCTIPTASVGAHPELPLISTIKSSSSMVCHWVSSKMWVIWLTPLLYQDLNNNLCLCGWSSLISTVQ